ncbi:MAG: polysaccharide pyruvyl transferase family protein [Bacteroidaceae bacterium]|nr:polysaccharide pyruvyl transferase family protein [Bacteroidaceae bacterium]
MKKRKKKISLITIFDNPNFGTYLQALALGVVLKSKDVDVEIVHYERPIWHTYSILRRKFKILEPLYNLRAFLRKEKSVIQRIRCRRFVSKRVEISPTYYSYEQLQKNPPKADIYLTGSDQVWNTTHNRGVDRSFYLGYAPESSPRFAYAASIGMDSIPKEFIEETKALLSRYQRISVREHSNINILSSIGIKSEMVLDPTLLLTRQEWMNYAKPMRIDEPYLLVYSVESKERDSLVGQIAKKIALSKGLKIYEVNYFGENKTISGCDKHFFYATPDLFLSLMANASYVVVSSFHGTAFAINFNKEFLSVAPDRFSSRLDNILELTGLKNRKVTDAEDVTDAMIQSLIDYSFANKKLDEERQKSMNFIEEILV